jgi:peptidoglycan/xylan/chitin deacetylase (PgdA/CDA1 family)
MTSTTRHKLCCISVDLDPLTAYYQIHGLGDPPLQLRYTILKKALPRFEELFAEAEVPATFFVVGRELERSEEAQAILRRMVEAGHELGNHTYTHPYDLGALPEQVIDAEIRRAHGLIVDLVGEEHAPRGFRKPGYLANAKILRVLANHGYRYDSSMFPSPPYYLAKLVVMAGMSLRGRRSGAVINDPRTLLCPADPYRPDPEHPWRRGQSPLVELPIASLPWTRLPAIGTFVAVSPPWIRRYLLDAMRGRAFFNFELHGIDLADAIEDRIPTELAGRQPDLRVPFVEKRKIFIRTLQELKQEYEFVTLDAAAAIVQREGRL